MYPPKLAMYLFANTGLGMSPGKLAAQVAHAAVKAYEISDADLIKQWNETGFTKLVMAARDEQHLTNIEAWLRGANPFGVKYPSVLIIDEGRTEIQPLMRTALGVAIVDRANPVTEGVFGEFQTLKPPKPPKEKKRKSILGR